jgi:hypothetical protein
MAVACSTAAAAATAAGPPPARGCRATGEVRPFHAEDAPAVAGLFRRVFGRRDDAASYLREIFLEHPRRDPELPSRVYLAGDGAVRGFLGVMPLPMSFGGRPVRAAVASSLMVESAASDPLAGARLLRAFFGGPQELSLTETANTLSRQMWMRLGAKPMPAHSLEWFRVLRPAGLGAYLAARRVPLLRLLQPSATAIGPLFAKLVRAPRPAAAAQGAGGAEVAPEDLAALVPAAVGTLSLRPDFDQPTLRWLLAHAALKEHYGSPIARVVHGRGGRPVGGYLAHFRPRGVLRVMQVFAAPSCAGAVIDDILAEGWRRGATAVVGKNQPEIMDALVQRRCLFRHVEWTMAHARSPELTDAIGRADACVNGLAGETWARLIGGDFGEGGPADAGAPSGRHAMPGARVRPAAMMTRSIAAAEHPSR